eukprot:2477370-Alexandrium_andersonii.AAC.1
MRYGFSFVWPAGGSPYFILPNGQHVVMRVSGGIPYLAPGDPRCQPRSRRSRKWPLCRGRMSANGTKEAAHPAAPAGSSDDAPVESDNPGDEPPE